MKTFLKINLLLVIIKIASFNSNFAFAKEYYDSAETRSSNGVEKLEKIVTSVSECRSSVKDITQTSEKFLWWRLEGDVKTCYNACYTTTFKNQITSYYYDKSDGSVIPGSGIEYTEIETENNSDSL